MTFTPAVDTSENNPGLALLGIESSRIRSGKPNVKWTEVPGNNNHSNSRPFNPEVFGPIDQLPTPWWVHATSLRGREAEQRQAAPFHWGFFRAAHDLEAPRCSSTLVEVASLVLPMLVDARELFGL